MLKKLECFVRTESQIVNYFKNKPYYSGYYEQIMLDIIIEWYIASLGINQLRHLKSL